MNAKSDEFKDVEGLPVEIAGRRVEPVAGSLMEFHGQHYITIRPVSDYDRRLWEFCVETRKLLQTRDG